MRTKATSSPAWPADLTPPRGILVLSGYGLSVSVWRGRLRVADGIGRERREAIVHRATGRLRRLVVLGHTGTVSLEAIRWLADLGAGYLQIDEDGRVLAALAPQGTDRPALRRAQARALDTRLGDDIAHGLIAEKIARQAETLKAVDDVAPIDDVAIDQLRSAGRALHLAVGRDEIRRAEAAAAAAYWSAWSPVSVRFARRDADRVPAHWRTFGARTSPLTASPRSAANPANALLNYLYALLESEATIAARVVGLDPGLGVLHADQLNRDSLSADLMEPVRPLVDRYLLELLRARPFAAADFYETRQGVCRVTPPLARELAATLARWRLEVGKVAEVVATILSGEVDAETPKPISGRRRAAGRRVGPRPPKREVLPEGACLWCGSAVERGRATCSQECVEALAAVNRPAFVAAGTRSLARLREIGFQPTISTAGRQRIGSRASETLAAAREWSKTHAWPTDLGVFAREILPTLTGVPAPQIAAATGLSVGYCRRVLAGRVTPNPMWWEEFRGLGSRHVDGPAEAHEA
jgi:CRISPR-associated endonuclease Cas1